MGNPVNDGCRPDGEVVQHEEREEIPRKHKRTLEDHINEVGRDKKCLKFCQTRRAYEEHKKFMEGKSLIDNKRLKELLDTEAWAMEYQEKVKILLSEVTDQVSKLNIA